MNKGKGVTLVVGGEGRVVSRLARLLCTMSSFQQKIIKHTKEMKSVTHTPGYITGNRNCSDVVLSRQTISKLL